MPIFLGKFCNSIQYQRTMRAIFFLATNKPIAITTTAKTARPITGNTMGIELTCFVV